MVLREQARRHLASTLVTARDNVSHLEETDRKLRSRERDLLLASESVSRDSVLLRDTREVRKCVARMLASGSETVGRLARQVAALGVDVDEDFSTASGRAYAAARSRLRVCSFLWSFMHGLSAFFCLIAYQASPADHCALVAAAGCLTMAFGLKARETSVSGRSGADVAYRRAVLGSSLVGAELLLSSLIACVDVELRRGPARPAPLPASFVPAVFLMAGACAACAVAASVAFRRSYRLWMVCEVVDA